MNYYNLVIYSSLLTAINSLIGSIELYSVKNIFLDQGIYRLENLKNDLEKYPKIVSTFILLLNQESLFNVFLVLKILLSLSLLFLHSPIILALLILLNLILTLRFKGAYNGGSDYMTMLTMLALLVSLIDLQNHRLSFLFMYLGVQVILSYFLAGFVKIKDNDWRTGSAIKNIVNGPNYHPPIMIKYIFNIPYTSFLACWLIIGFELLFPLIIFIPQHLTIVICGLVTFHFLNFIIFGLNRFFFAWLASYPALIYFVTNLPSTK